MGSSWLSTNSGWLNGNDAGNGSDTYSGIATWLNSYLFCGDSEGWCNDGNHTYNDLDMEYYYQVAGATELDFDCPAFDCDGGNCVDPLDGTGQYLSYSACQQNCTSQ